MVPSFVADLHEDIAMYYASGEGYGFEEDAFDRDVGGRQGDLPKYERGNVRLVFASVFPLMRTLDSRISDMFSQGYEEPTSAFVPRAPMLTALEMIKIYYELQARNPDRIAIIRTPRDLAGIQRAHKLGFLISLEGTEAISVPSDIKILWNLGVRCVGMTWNLDTQFGSSCMSKRDYGLTGMGHSLLTVANEMGMVIDLAHAGKQTCLDVLDNSSLPVVISHANYFGVHNTPRNVDGEVLSRLKHNRGVLGFTLIPSTIGDKHDISALTKHILAVRDEFGPDLLAIGTDYFGLLYPDNPPKGLEDISRIPRLWKDLRNQGLTEQELEAIQYKNALRVLESNAERWRT